MRLGGIGEGESPEDFRFDLVLVEQRPDFARKLLRDFRLLFDGPRSQGRTRNG